MRHIRILLSLAALISAFPLALTISPVRIQAATFTVNNTGDGGDTDTTDGVCIATTGGCTLRAAIEQANAAINFDTINFSIAGAGVHTIAPLSSFPAIFQPAEINGYSQPGTSENTLAVGNNAVINIRLEGTNAGAASGLVVVAGDSTIKGLKIHRFTGNGIFITQRPGNTVRGNFIGTEGFSLNDGNGFNGVEVHNCAQNTIGGTTPAARNLISKNGISGVAVNGAISTNNLIQGNYIGTDANGLSFLGDYGNAQDGVLISVDAGANTVGGTTATPGQGAGNLISGNGNTGNLNADGIEINGSLTTGNTVRGNMIGMEPDGNTAFRNEGNGILIDDSPGNTIGGGNSGFSNALNLISSHTNTAAADGIEISGENADNNIIKGNYIGTNGSADRGNSGNGILIQGGADNTTVGTLPSERNVISGNDSNGIRITGAGTNDNKVYGNYIGTDTNGTLDVGNSFDGVSIENGAGAAANPNVIGDFVALGVGQNIISGNDNDGVEISGSPGNVVRNNLIGLQFGGNNPLGNNADGVFINNAPSNLISSNTISAQTFSVASNGVEISGTVADNNTVFSNYIGVNEAGDADRGNAGNGVYIHNDADLNTIDGNVISGNDSDGVEISDAATTGNKLFGNRIGTNAAQNAGLPNSGHGVFITLSSANNTIGTPLLADRNAIAFNGGDGVYVESGTGNDIRGNAIYSNIGLGIDLGPNGVTANDPSDPDTGANNLQNFPLLSSAAQGSTIIMGTLNSTPSTSFTLDFYSNIDQDPSQHGEGRTYLGTSFVTTNASGNASFTATFPPTTPIGHFISATATDPNSNTSEFSAGRLVTGPTAAAVSISGRVLSFYGRGISGARVFFTEQNGATRTAIANAFGYYRFDEVAVGQTYAFSVLSKRYQFSPRVVTVNDNIADLDFVADP